MIESIEKPRAMKILAVHRYYWPDTAPYASMLRKIVAKWQSLGHQVDVISSQPSYKSELDNQHRDRVEVLDGATVLRLYLPNENGKPFRRVANALKLGVMVVWKAITERYDVIMISTSPPILGGVFSAIAAKLTGARLIYHCMDVHPEIGRISGEFSNPFIFKILLKLDCWTCKCADQVVVLSEDMKHSIMARSKDAKINTRIINNFSLPSDDGNLDVLPFDWPDSEFVMLFAGNIGRFQGLDVIVEAMAKLKHRKDIQFVMMGEGAEKKALKEKASSLGANVRFVGHQPVELAKAAMRKANFGFVSLTADIYRYAYPSKTMAYLEQGCPLVVIVEPESVLAREVIDGGYGYVVTPGDSGSLALLIEKLVDFKGDNERMRRNALNKFEESFLESKALSQWEGVILNEVVDK